MKSSFILIFALILSVPLFTANALAEEGQTEGSGTKQTGSGGTAGGGGAEPECD